MPDNHYFTHGPESPCPPRKVLQPPENLIHVLKTSRTMSRMYEMRDVEMDCNEVSEREIMKRTMALLFSLAAMAEGVAVRSYFVRCYILWILRRAETSALRYVIGSDAAPSRFILHRNAPVDALRLAQSLRELALALKDELRQDRHFSSWWMGRNLAAAPERIWIGAGRQFALPSGKRATLSGFAWTQGSKPSPAPARLQACRVLPPP